MKLIVKDIDGVQTLCESDETIRIIKSEWELIEAFLKDNPKLWKKFYKENY